MKNMGYVVVASCALLVACGGPSSESSSEEGVGQLEQPLALNELGFVHSPFPTDYLNAFTAASYNSLGRQNEVVRSYTGHYEVKLGGLGSVAGGSVQLTPVADGMCSIDGWWRAGGDALSIFVSCFDKNGAAKDNGFAAAYFSQSGNASRGGYVWANDATAASYTPDPTYSWNSSGGGIDITRAGLGTYDVFFSGLSFTGGTAQVSAYGPLAYCNVVYWFPSSPRPDKSGQQVRVACFDPQGRPKDSRFTLSFNDDSPNNTTSYAYAWASSPSTQPNTPYTPDLTYQKAYAPNVAATNLPPTAPITFSRDEVGVYRAYFPSAFVNAPHSKSHAKVSAYGGNTRCGLWYANQSLIVCYDAAGNPADSLFTYSYGRMP